MINIFAAEIDLVSHCNLRCYHCSVASPYMEHRIYDLSGFRNDIFALSKVIHMNNHIKFIGGEPLLVQNIAEYVKVIRESGISNRVAIITNGTLLETAEEEGLASFDFVAITLYNNLPEALLCKVQRGIERLKRILPEHKINISQPKHEFFMSEVDCRIDDQIVDRIWRECWQKDGCNSICDGYVYRCTAGNRREKYLRAIGIENANCPKVNGCPIHEPDLEFRLKSYLEANEPPEMCHYCLGCSGKHIPHRQMAVEEIRNHKPMLTIPDYLK